MAKGGGGGTNVTKFEAPDYVQPYAKEYLRAVGEQVNRPYEQFQGITTAPWNQYQNQGAGLAVNRATNGAPDINAARNQTTNTLSGQYQNPYADVRTYVPGNPYADAQNPELQNQINYALDDTVSAYRRGTAAQTDAAASRDRAYGGSAYNQTVQANQGTLARALGQTASGIRYQDYTNRANLTESGINRGVQAFQGDIGRASGAYEAERGRQLQAVPLGFQGGQQDYVDANVISGVGDAQQKYTQQLLNDAYGEFQRAQTYPYAQADILANAITRSSGGVGTNTSTATAPRAASGLTGAIGGGLAGYAAQQYFPNAPGQGFYPLLGAALGGFGG